MAHTNYDFLVQSGVAVANTTVGQPIAVITNTATVNAQVGTTYTFVLSDASYDAHSGNLVTFNNAAAITATIPTNATLPFPIGSKIDGIQKGVGKVTIAGAVGVTINSVSGNKSVSNQNGGFTLIKESADTWYLLGALAA